jgi:hypothetical protein
MKGLFAGLTVCLLVSLLLVLVADGARRGCPPLLASLGQAVRRLQGGEWAIPSIWSDRALWFRLHAGEAGWEFLLEKGRWRNTHCHLRWIRPDSSGRYLLQNGDADTGSGGFQGSVGLRE